MLAADATAASPWLLQGKQLPTVAGLMAVQLRRRHGHRHLRIAFIHFANLDAQCAGAGIFLVHGAGVAPGLVTHDASPAAPSGAVAH